MIRSSLTKRVEELEKAADMKGLIPVLFVEENADDRMKRPEFAPHVTMEQYESGNLPRGVTERTVIMIDDIPKEVGAG